MRTGDFFPIHMLKFLKKIGENEIGNAFLRKSTSQNQKFKKGNFPLLDLKKIGENEIGNAF